MSVVGSQMTARSVSLSLPHTLHSSVPSSVRSKLGSLKSRLSVSTSVPVRGRKCQSLCACGCMKDDNVARSTSKYSLSETEGSIRDEVDPRDTIQRPQSSTIIAKKIDKYLKQTKNEGVKASVEIEIGKIRKLLAETINVITFAMCVPQLVENDYALLRKHVSSDFVETVSNLLDHINFKTCSLFSAGEYEFRRTNFFTESSASTVEKFYSEYKEKPRVFSERKEIEDIWNAVNLLYEKANEIPQLFTNDMKHKLPDHVKDLLDTLEKLFDHIIGEMKKSPREVEFREIELSKMFMSFEQQNNEMVALHGLLRPTIENNLLSIMDVCHELQSLKDQRTKLKEFLISSHQRIRNNLEKNTMLYNLEALKTTKEKMGPRNELINKHEKLMKEDLAEEKACRVKKYKVEQVLQGVINKYETDMNNRNAKLAHLNEMYDMEMAQMKQMQERYDAQETVYNLLMEEKAKYEQAVWDAKLEEIQRIIAARKIQRFYRGYLAFMQAQGRRKGKGKGKGKKRS